MKNIKANFSVVLVAVIISLIIVFDQITKWVIRANYLVHESTKVITDFFSITYIRNTGAAFGFGSKFGEVPRIMLFKVLPVLACLWLAWLIYTTPKGKNLLRTAYVLILAGAIGNLIDRFYFGFVVDFLDFNFGFYHYPAFNVADSSITIGGFLLAYELIFIQSKELKVKQEEA